MLLSKKAGGRHGGTYHELEGAWRDGGAGEFKRRIRRRSETIFSLLLDCASIIIHHLIMRS